MRAAVSMLQPPVLVLDEPTSNLDVSAIRELREIVGRWKMAGKTIFIAEHRLRRMDSGSGRPDQNLF